MKLFLYFLVGLLCLTSSQSQQFARNKRTIFSLFNHILPYSNCASRDCPPWKCQDDSAVIHGYCCHCPGSEYDNVPVPCYPDMKCPASSQPLCSDYNFMMDCCCTGH